jgi:hypothetical protein
MTALRREIRTLRNGNAEQKAQLAECKTRIDECDKKNEEMTRKFGTLLQVYFCFSVPDLLNELNHHANYYVWKSCSFLWLYEQFYPPYNFGE